MSGLLRKVISCSYCAESSLSNSKLRIACSNLREELAGQSLLNKLNTVKQYVEFRERKAKRQPQMMLYVISFPYALHLLRPVLAIGIEQSDEAIMETDSPKSVRADAQI